MRFARDVANVYRLGIERVLLPIEKTQAIARVGLINFNKIRKGIELVASQLVFLMLNPLLGMSYQVSATLPALLRVKSISTGVFCIYQQKVALYRQNRFLKA